jgi:predicted transcriptional regulator
METTNENATSLALEAHIADIVSSYLAKNQVAPSDLPGLISSVYQSLRSLGQLPEPEPPSQPYRSDNR